MTTAIIFNTEYKVTERVKRMLDAVKACNASIQLILSFGLISGEIVKS